MCNALRNYLDISIHSPHARGDGGHSAPPSELLHFNPLPSCEGRRRGRCAPASPSSDFNPLPSCEGRRLTRTSLSRWARISIHSPHARGDSARRRCISGRSISIHSPHARGDHRMLSWARVHILFQSTPLMRGETMIDKDGIRAELISIHSPHARGDLRHHGRDKQQHISIHSPHARGDREGGQD